MEIERKKSMKKINFSALIIFLIFGIAEAQVATSTNYRLQTDSLSFGGNVSNSTNYGVNDTIGGNATGVSNSTNYTINAGYQQMLVSSISINSPSDVTLTSITNTGSSNGSISWTVITDNPAGYTLSIKAGSSPALSASGGSFSDYSPVGGSTPDYAWSVSSNSSAFGFSPEGTDVYSTYLDNGTACNTGSSNAGDTCWDGFSTSNKTIASRSGSNSPTGIATTVKLKAEIGSSKSQTAGDYSATITATAIAL